MTDSTTDSTKSSKLTMLSRFIHWRERNLSERSFLLILGLIVGIVASLAAFLLKSCIHLLQSFATTFAQEYNILYLILPPLGIFLTALIVMYIVRDDIGHGVTKILIALSQRKSRIKPHNMWSSLLSSAVTIGFGGSVGAESPIVLTGAAIGSNIGRLFKMDTKNLMLLVGCGAAAAIAGIFKAPIAGLIFVVEILLMDLTLNSVLPLLTASATATIFSYLVSGSEPFFTFSQTQDYIPERIPYTILLGVVCGFIALFFSKVMFSLEKRFKKIKNYGKKFLIAALVLSLLIFLLPPLYGEGYSTIELLLSGKESEILKGSLFESWGGNFWILSLFLLLTMLLKVFASVATNSGGGCGGLFAPTLFVGGIAGFLFSFAIGHIPFVQTILPTENFTLMGMSGMMSAVMHAPLTGVFLIAELTGGYELFLPLMLASLSAYATIRIFMPHSIYSLRLAEQGKLLTHEKDKAVLTIMDPMSVLETDFITVTPEKTLGDVVKLIGSGRRNIFPVVDENKKLRGLVLLDDIRNIMFRPELYERFKVTKFMISPPATIVMPSSMEQIMKIFDKSKAWNLPVINSEGHYLGMLSKSRIFNTYREVLTDLSAGD